MEEVEQKPTKNGEKTGKDPITGKFVEGNNFGTGKPLGTRSFTTKVKEALEKIADGKDYTYEEAFIKAILKKSIVDQDVSMMRTVWEQLDGKPLQKVEMSGGLDLSVLEGTLKNIANGNAIIENSKDGADPLQGRDGKADESNGKPMSDIPADIQEALQ